MLAFAEIVRRVTVEAAHRIGDVLSSFQPCRRAFELAIGEVAFSRPDEGAEPEQLHRRKPDDNDQNYSNQQQNLHPTFHPSPLVEFTADKVSIWLREVN